MNGKYNYRVCLSNTSKKEKKKKSDEKIIENHTRQFFLIVFI